MTQDGLNELRELATEADELQRKADELDIRICNLYQYEEDVLDQDAYTMLTKASASMQKAAWRLGRAIEEMQRAYEYEKALMDYYEGLLNKQDNDEE
jgi:hypothetical protein